MIWNRLAVNLFFFVNGFLYANWVSRLPKIQELYGMDNGTTGWVLLIIAIGALLAMPFTGWIIVGNGSKKVTWISGLLFCAAVPFIPIFPEIWQLAIAFFVMGLATGTMDVAMNAQAVMVEKLYNKPIMSSFHAVFSGGMMLGAGSGALFTKMGASLSWHFIIVGVGGLLTLLFVIPYLVQDHPEQKEKEKSSKFRLPSKELVGIGFIAFCCMLGEGAMADWSTNYMENIALADEVLAPLGLAAFSTAMMLGRIFGDKARIVFGDGKLLIGNSLISLLGILLVVLFPTPSVVILGLFGVGLGLSVIVPIAYSQAGSSKNVSPGVGIGMVTTIGYSGFLFGPPIIGIIADWQTLRFAMLFVLMLFIAMVILSWKVYLTLKS